MVSIAPSTKGSGTTVGVLYPGHRGPPVMTHSSGYDRFPLAVNDWGMIHPISNMVPPLLAEEEGPST
jgi:hypothetical protein